MDQPFCMCTFWREDKGLVSALRDYYPDLCKNSDLIRQALAQIENAEAAINQFMESQPDDSEG